MARNAKSGHGLGPVVSQAVRPVWAGTVFRRSDRTAEHLGLVGCQCPRTARPLGLGLRAVPICVGGECVQNPVANVLAGADRLRVGISADADRQLLAVAEAVSRPIR